MLSTGNQSAIVIGAYLFEGLTLDPQKGLECWVIINSPSNTGIIATMRKIMIQPNDTLTFKSGTNPEKNWRGIEDIHDEVVVQPNSLIESDIYINYNAKHHQSDRMGGWEAVFTAFKGNLITAFLP